MLVMLYQYLSAQPMHLGGAVRVGSAIEPAAVAGIAAIGLTVGGVGGSVVGGTVAITGC